MKTIFCLNPYEDIPRRYFEKGSSVSLGNFDGCHLGHQEILYKTIKAADYRKIPSVIFTFYPHPRDLFTPHNKTKKIFSLDQKASFFEKLGVNFLIIQKFNHEFCKLTHENFYEKILKDTLQAKSITIGSNFKFGNERKGTSCWLRKKSSQDNIQLEALKLSAKGENLISSSSIRNLIDKGYVKEAQKILGHSFSIEGTIIHGKGMGKAFGFPTANFGNIQQILPKPGVYVGFIKKNKKKSLAVINVGFKPTIENKKTSISVEAHAIENTSEFEEAYGKSYSLSFHERLRDEFKFPSTENLIKQIEQDVSTAKKLFLEKRLED